MSTTKTALELRTHQVSMRVSLAYWEWLESLIEVERMGLPDVLDRALSDYAAKVGHREPPPRRR